MSAGDLGKQTARVFSIVTFVDVRLFAARVYSLAFVFGARTFLSLGRSCCFSLENQETPGPQQKGTTLGYSASIHAILLPQIQSSTDQIPSRYRVQNLC